MKVLLIVHPEMDHQEAFTFVGLTKLIGEENVITCPFKKSYYGIGDDDYILDDGKKGFTSPYEGILPRKGIPFSLSKIKEIWDTIDLVVMGTVRTYGVRALRELKNEIGTRWWQPLIFVEGEDSDRIWWELVQEFKPSVYFKREYRKDVQIRYPSSFKFWPPIIPCPFSAINERIPPLKENREINVYSVCGHTHEMRTAVTHKLASMNILNSCIWMDNVFMDSNLGHRDNLLGYYTSLVNSKIGVAVRGHGMDTLRFWETPACGALLFTHDNNQIHPNPFEDGKNCVLFKNDLSDFEEKLRYYLEDENECRKVAANGNSHLLKYHTSEKRANYILDKTKELVK